MCPPLASAFPRYDPCTHYACTIAFECVGRTRKKDKDAKSHESLKDTIDSDYCQGVGV